ncbi:MAG: sigma-54-dependent Fis family transcriptional regulator [Desulfobacter sp.]|nr:sigma-54-dependent Fis family transcriptional regulator [Desulfobacter sp.]WDP85053.1 MAG: sigma-54-dependent Fis family transcriptional regulator [Desulfobacter sp.]
MGNSLNAKIFQSVTQKICGNLDLSEALYQTFSYLKNKIPIVMIFLSRYESGHTKKSARLIAFANDDGGSLVDEPIIIPQSVGNYLDTWLKKSADQTLPWVRDHKNPMNINIKEMLMNRFSYRARQIANAPFSTITCALKIQDQVIGNFTMMREGPIPYNQSHTELIQAINQPFAIALSNALRYRELEQHHKALQSETSHRDENLMIGSDSGLRKVRQLIEDVAPTDSPVILLGNTGTGKEVATVEIHKLSDRCKGPMINVNCGAIPETLIDSELFGHEKGAFTGAIEARPGRFERAHKGTLFLDEIGELPLSAQVKLLRILQAGEFERVGGLRNLKVNVRIIAATNRNIPQRIKKGKFRTDLWYRLNVFPITIPDLKYRKQDIPAMVDYFISKKCREMNLTFRPKLACNAVEQLQTYDWPGNVRELENIIERALILSKGKPLSFFELTSDEDSQLEKFSRQPKSENPIDSHSFKTLNTITVSHINAVLNYTRGKISGPGGAAKILDIHPNTLRNRMVKLGMQNQFPRVDQHT